MNKTNPKGASDHLRILFLNQIFAPEPAVKSINFVKSLQSRGHTVKVVTCFPSYPGGRVYSGYKLALWQHEQIEGVKILRLFNIPSHNLSGLWRSIHFGSFMISAFFYILFNGWRFDVVYVGHPGITTGLSALFGGWIWRLPYIVEIQDLWPDSIATSPVSGSSTFSKIVNPLCNLVYRRARLIVAQSENMGKEIASRAGVKDKIRVIYNWALGVPKAPLTDALDSNDKFPIIYAGNLGAMQALHKVIEAACIAAKTEPRVELWLLGGGIDKPRLQDVATKLGATNVKFLPRVPDEELHGLLSKAGAFLLHLAKSPLVEFTIPSKSQFYLALGKPILAGISGEIGHMMQKSGAAVVVPPEDEVQIANAMVALAQMPKEERQKMGEAGKKFYAATFSYEHALDQTYAVLKEISDAKS